MTAGEEDIVTIDVPQIGRRMDRWSSYSVNSDYLTATDGWEFAFGNDGALDQLVRELGVGLKVEIRVNGALQGCGYIDEFGVSNERGGGTEVTISGRDLLGPVIDGHIDPTTQFKAGQTLADVLEAVFAPYGLTSFAVDSAANRGVLVGQTRGVLYGKPSKKTGARPLKSFVVHQLKPYPKEGAFAFAARLAQRHGLWIRLAADGKTVLVAKPDFDQQPSYQLVRKRGDQGRSNTVLRGSVKRSAAQQPTALVCTGRSGGGAQSRAGMRVIAINTAVAGETAPLLARYPSAKVIGLDGKFPFAKYIAERAKPLFLEDPESQTLEQLENFARRELALLQRRSFEARYIVQGHAAPDGGVWSIDTMVDVQDDVLDIHEPLYVLGRTLHKSRSGGTYAELHLIRPYTMVF